MDVREQVARKDHLFRALGVRVRSSGWEASRLLEGFARRGADDAFAPEHGLCAKEQLVEAFARQSAHRDAVRRTGERPRIERVDGIDLVVNEQAWCFTELERLEHRVDGAHVTFVLGVGGVDDVQKQVGVREFFKGCAKRIDERFRQSADEPDRVGQDDLPLARKAQTAARWVEGREELVFNEHVALRERVQKRALACVRVPDDGDDGQFVARAPAAAQLAVVPKLLDALFEVGDAIAYPPPVDLQLRFPRAPAADAACESAESLRAARQPGQSVLQLRELDLELAVGALGALRENVEDELRAVDDLQARAVGEVPGLRRRQVVVEDEKVDHELHRAQVQVSKLALADGGARVHVCPRLNEHVDDFNARRSRKLLELGHRRLGLCPPLRRDADEYRPSARSDVARADEPAERRLDCIHLVENVEVDGERVGIGARLPKLVACRGRSLRVEIVGRQPPDVHPSRQSVAARFDGADEIQAKKRKVGEVVLRERLFLQVNVNEPQTAQSPLARALTPDVGQLEPERVADDDLRHLAPAIDEHPDLTTRLARDFRQMARKLGARHFVGLHAPTPRRLQLLHLARLQPERFAVDVANGDVSRPSGRKTKTPEVSPSVIVLTPEAYIDGTCERVLSEACVEAQSSRGAKERGDAECPVASREKAGRVLCAGARALPGRTVPVLTARSPIMHTPRHQLVRQSRRILVKIGSGVLTGDGGAFDRARFVSLCRGLAHVARTHELVVVSSGAIALGVEKLGLKSRPKDIPGKQAAAAVGQLRLMGLYEDEFDAHGLTVAQVLLTHADIQNRKRYLNARNALGRLVEHGVVPVINENDTVSVEELKFGDNDSLAGMTVDLVGADLLVILTDIDGVYTADPRIDPTARKLDEIAGVTDDVLASGGESRSGVGTGGMATKLRAARRAGESGVATVIAPGKRDGVLEALLAGEPVGTFIRAPSDCRAGGGRKRWIGRDVQTRGEVRVDAGAVRALVDGHTSLLPSGVRDVRGHFAEGDAIVISDLDGRAFARGLSVYSGDDLRRIRGVRSSEIESILGYKSLDEAVHRDDLVILDSLKE